MLCETPWLNGQDRRLLPPPRQSIARPLDAPSVVGYPLNETRRRPPTRNPARPPWPRSGQPLRHREHAGLPCLDPAVRFGGGIPRGRPRSEERRVGKGVSVRVDLGGRRIIKKKKTKNK